MTPPLIAALMDAQSWNAKQRRALYNATPEVDSAIEHTLVVLKTATDAQRPHLLALLALLRDVFKANEQELRSQRLAAGIADPVSNVHEFVKLVRPLLADLLNPIVPERKKAKRLGELHALFARTVPRTRSSFSCRPLLGSPAKYGELLARLEEWEQLVAVECVS